MHARVSYAAVGAFVLLLGAALVAISPLPLIGLALPGAASSDARRFPRGAFITRYLLVFSLWSIAAGAFNPFFNAYFARRFAASPDAIGALFSAGQVSQVIALLAAPAILARLGNVRGIGMMMVVTGVLIGVVTGVMGRVLVAGGHKGILCAWDQSFLTWEAFLIWRFHRRASRGATKELKRLRAP